MPASNNTNAPIVIPEKKDVPPLLEIRGVNHSFGHGENRKQVLFDNNLTVYPGEIVIMTGPSGSGKTTLLTLIGALRSLQEGSLKFLGRELNGLSKAEQVRIRRDIGFIFQAHNLFESLTAFENVRLATELHDYTREEASRLATAILADLGLAERTHYKPQNLSGGQRQRVAIGRALVNSPKLILADEPTAALDKVTGRHVVNMIQALAKQKGCSALIVTHDNRILDVADRIVNMVDGVVVSDVAVAENEAVCKLLRKCSVFQNTTPTLLADVAGKVKEEDVGTGTVIIRQGEVGDKFYIIRKGTVEIEILRQGHTTTVAKLGPGEFFGEIALLRDEPRNATVRALEPVELLTLTKEQFIDIVKHSATFEEQLKKVYFSR